MNSLTSKQFLLLAILFLGLFSPKPSLSQYVPIHISHEGIYAFMDELATLQLIDFSTLIKPYSRKEIANKLQEAEDQRDQLNSRQQSELDFYLRDYMKELPSTGNASTSWLWQKNHGDKRFDVFHYRDSLFQITVNPILGTDVWSNSNGTFHHWWNGVEAWSYAGKFGFWASLRDNHESTELTSQDFQNQRLGGSRISRFSNGYYEFEEFRGGITYAWKWGHVGLIMDQFSWGEHNAGSNIYSGRTPAFPRFDLSMKPAHWFSFSYIAGMMVSEVVDSSLSFITNTAYGEDYREVYHRKYISANMFSFTPVQGLQLSAGNSVVYDFRLPNLGFLVPVAFYKAIDHTVNAGIDNMNSQLFLSLSSRNLKDFHFYGTVFIDEFAAGRVFNDEEFNFVSYKAGASTTILNNTRFFAEYTWTNALTFMHYVPTTTFESNQYNLGHYLEDNAKDFYTGLEYRPVRTLNIRTYYHWSVKGPDHTALGTDRLGIFPFDPIVWKSTRLGVQASIQITHDLIARIGMEWRNVSGEQDYLDRWTPEEYHGKTGTLRFGLNYGF